MGVGVEGEVGDGVEAGVGVVAGVVVGAPHWQPVTTTTKGRRQMPTAHIVTFRMVIYTSSSVPPIMCVVRSNS